MSLSSTLYNSDRSRKVNEMTKTPTETKDSAKQTRKLSPELNEFLHMLQALEGRLDTPAANAR